MQRTNARRGSCRFTPAFQVTGIDPSPLQMPVREDRTFLFTDLPLETYKRLPAMLSDALPDDFGNALINRYGGPRHRRAGGNATRPPGLHEQSRNGALQFEPARGLGARRPTAIELSTLVTEARKAVTAAPRVIDEVRAAVQEWPTFAARAGLSSEQTTAIADQLIFLR